MLKLFKNINLILCSFLIFINQAFAFEYSENDKNMFYDAFIDGYIAELSKAVNKLDIDKTKKSEFINELKSKINKDELINSSWNCITKYPIEQIVAASVICTTDWSKTQNEKNKEIMKSLK